MYKLVVVIALCAALAACKREDAAPTAIPVPAESGEVPTVSPRPAASTVPDPMPMRSEVGADIPAACAAYFKRTEACYAAAGTAIAGMQGAIEQSRAQMLEMPAQEMEASCKTANDEFTQTAVALKCE